MYMYVQSNYVPQFTPCIIAMLFNSVLAREQNPLVSNIFWFNKFYDLPNPYHIQKNLNAFWNSWIFIKQSRKEMCQFALILILSRPLLCFLFSLNNFWKVHHGTSESQKQVYLDISILYQTLIMQVKKYINK